MSDVIESYFKAAKHNDDINFKSWRTNKDSERAIIEIIARGVCMDLITTDSVSVKKICFCVAIKYITRVVLHGFKVLVKVVVLQWY